MGSFLRHCVDIKQRHVKLLPCERLFSGAPDTHKKRVATLLTYHASNTRHVLYSIHEEH